MTALLNSRGTWLAYSSISPETRQAWISPSPLHLNLSKQSSYLRIRVLAVPFLGTKTLQGRNPSFVGSPCPISGILYHSPKRNGKKLEEGNWVELWLLTRGHIPSIWSAYFRIEQSSIIKAGSWSTRQCPRSHFLVQDNRSLEEGWSHDITGVTLCNHMQKLPLRSTV